jgi:hypothetical protein
MCKAMECIQSAISWADKHLFLLYSALNLFRKKPPSISTAIFVGGSVCNVSFLIFKKQARGWACSLSRFGRCHWNKRRRERNRVCKDTYFFEKRMDNYNLFV